MTTPDLRPLLVIHVLGTPRPKGSLRPFVAANGKARAREQIAGSPDWRRAVALAAEAAYNSAADPWPINAPYLGAVKVTIVLELPRPLKPKDPHYPTGGNTGDVDKHARNILDALQDAGVIKHDSQVVDLAVSKRWTTFAPGAHITVWPAAAIEESPRPGGAAIDSPPPGGATVPEWFVDHPGIGKLPYPNEAAARAAAGTAGTIIHNP